MIDSKKVIVVMPAYNAEKTLIKTYNEIPKDIVDEVILTDDASRDNTIKVAEKLNIPTIIHDSNKGYGANQKTCYMEALKLDPDIIGVCCPFCTTMFEDGLKTWNMDEEVEVYDIAELLAQVVLTKED